MNRPLLKVGLSIALLLGSAASIAVLSGTAFLLANANPAGKCEDPTVTDLVIQILGEQLKVTGQPKLANIRKMSGGWLDQRYECVADIKGGSGPDSLAGLAFSQVSYTSEITLPDRRQYVTARLVPVATP